MDAYKPEIPTNIESILNECVPDWLDHFNTVEIDSSYRDGIPGKATWCLKLNFYAPDKTEYFYPEFDHTPDYENDRENHNDKVSKIEDLLLAKGLEVNVPVFYEIGDNGYEDLNKFYYQHINIYWEGYLPDFQKVIDTFEDYNISRNEYRLGLIQNCSETETEQETKRIALEQLEIQRKELRALSLRVSDRLSEVNDAIEIEKNNSWKSNCYNQN